MRRLPRLVRALLPLVILAAGVGGWVLISSRHSSGSRPRPTVLAERIGENGVTWKLVTYSSRAGPCVDILGFSAEGTALGGPGGCGPALTPELGSRLTPEAPKVLAQGQLLVGAVGTGTTFALVGGTASCASCALTVSWSDGATTTDRATDGLFLSFRELGPDGTVHVSEVQESL